MREMKDFLPYRIKIGVTGHRKDLPDTELLKAKIKSILGYRYGDQPITFADGGLLALFTHHHREQAATISKSIPLVYTIYSALAEGTDCLVAEAVLEHPSARLEVTLPLTKEEYEKDFMTESAQNRFRDLLKKAESVSVIKPPKQTGTPTPEEIQDHRNESYLRAGQQIVRDCDLMIAVWDGKEAQGKGGTGDVVRYARETGKPMIIISSHHPDQVTCVPGDGLSFESLHHFHHLVSFHLSPDKTTWIIRNNFNEFYTHAHESMRFLDEAKTQTLQQKLLPLFARASEIATRSKFVFENSGLLVFLLSLMSIIVVLIAVIFTAPLLPAFILEFLMLIGILLIIHYANRSGLYKNWLANRFFVEKLRSTIFLFVSGLALEKLNTRSGNAKHNRHYSWAIQAYNEVCDQLNAAHPAHIEETFLGEIKSYISEVWIGGQISFQQRYSRKHEQKNRMLERSGIYLFVIAMSFAFMHIVLSLTRDLGLHIDYLEEFLTLFALVIPPVAAALDGIRNQRGYSRNAMRSEGMIHTLEELQRRIEDVKTPEHLKQFLRETDRVMLHENQDWMMLMSTSDLEFRV